MLDVFFLTTKQFCLFLLFPLLKDSSGKYRVFLKWIISVVTSSIYKYRFKIYWVKKKPNIWGHWLCPFTIVLNNNISFLTPPNINWKKKILILWQETLLLWLGHSTVNVSVLLWLTALPQAPGMDVGKSFKTVLCLHLIVVRLKSTNHCEVLAWLSREGQTSIKKYLPNLAKDLDCAVRLQSALIRFKILKNIFNAF